MFRISTLLGSFLALILCVTTATAQNYRVRPGDTLRIEVIEDSNLDRTVLVAPDGRISLPGTGQVRAGGRTMLQIQRSLTAQLAPNFANPPNVHVSLEELRPTVPSPPAEDPVTAVFVTGEIKNAGRVELEPGTTLLQAIAQFGGFTNFAATKRVQLHRSAKIYTVNFDAILKGTSPNGTVRLREGDVIIVPQRRLFE